MIRYYIYLLQIFGGGNPKINEIIGIYKSARKAAEAIISGDMKYIPQNRIQNVRKASLDISDKVIEYCKNSKIEILTLEDKRYPVLLKNIFNPPALIFVQGDITCLDGRLAISVVGPRKPDEYSQKLAHHICTKLAGCKAVLVSGFAYGIDSIAHTAALTVKTPTVAVLACGTAVEYPDHSFAFRDKVIADGGAIITELLPDTGCCAGYFAHRNRIISGLSNGTVVIGADNKSGSMLTARHAYEQDRELFFTIPKDTLNPIYSNVIKYLRDGAHPVYDAYDIINEFYAAFKDKLDDTFLDKRRLSSFASISEQENADKTLMPLNDKPENSNDIADVAEKKAVKETKPDTKEDTVPTTEKLPEKIRTSNTGRTANPVVNEKRFIARAGGDNSKQLDYSSVTPERFMKKKRRAPIKGIIIQDDEKGKDIPELYEADIAKPQKKTEAVIEAVRPVNPDVSENNSDDNNDISAEILALLTKNGALTVDKIISNLNSDFGTVTEALTDMELDGIVKSGAGGRYSVS